MNKEQGKRSKEWETGMRNREQEKKEVKKGTENREQEPRNRE